MEITLAVGEAELGKNGPLYRECIMGANGTEIKIS